MSSDATREKGASAPFSLPDPLPQRRDAWRELIETKAPTHQRHGLLRALEKMPDEALKEGGPRLFRERVFAALEKTALRAALVPENLPCDENLPICGRRDEIVELIRNHQVVVIAGETGSGKTTQIPKLCLEAGLGRRGMIGCTQPRRLAARSVAQRIADELETTLGDKVGYQVRFHAQVGKEPLIKVMTDGILLAEIQNDRYLSRYDTIIIDEAHERSLNIDFLLGYLKQLLPERPDLKVIITSATIDTEAFSRHFDNAPVIEVSGRTYPVEIRYRPLEAVSDDAGNTFEPTVNDAIIDALDELAQIDPFGDVLVFLVGERDIKEAAEAIRKHGLKNTEVMGLYARQSLAEQQKIFQPNPHKRRVILATNVAETSLTVPGIKFVIDTGLVRISRYSPNLKVMRLPIEKISQASANQRAGRCGRVSSGVCIRLYSEEDFQSRPRFTDPEIKRTSLATAILRMKQLGLGDIERFPFIEPPASKQINDGLKALHELNALTPKGRLTEIGRQLAKLPVDPHFGRMILEAQKNDVLAETLIVVAALSIQDPRDINEQTQAAASRAHAKWQDPRSDFLFFIHLWHFYEYQKRHLSQNKLRKLCRTNYLSWLRMREWHDLFMQLKQSLKQMGIAVPEPHPLEVCDAPDTPDMRLSETHAVNLHRTLLAGLLGGIAMRDEQHAYLGARNSKLYIHPSSVLFKQKPKWIVSAERVETTKLWARNNAPIDPRWVEALAGHLVKRNYQDPHWEAKPGQVGAYENVTLYGLPLVARRKINYGRVNPKEAHEIFLRALAAGEVRTRADAIVHNQRLRRDIEKLEHKIRRPDLLVEEDVLFDFYKARIPDHIYSQPAFEKWYRGLSREARETLKLTREQLLKRAPDRDWEADFPDQIAVDNRLPLKVRYTFAPGERKDGMHVQVPIEALTWLDERPFGFLTPGLLPEKVQHYLKALPGRLRKRLVPLPDSAKRIAAAMKPEEGDFLSQLQKQVQRELGEPVSLDLFQGVELPAHLIPKFVLRDNKGKVLGVSESLEEMRSRFAAKLGKLSRSASKDAQPWVGWQEDVIPDHIEERRGGQTLVLYPALVKTEKGVVLKTFPRADEARCAHAEGVQALLMQQLKDKADYLRKKLPLKQACLRYAPYGSCDELKQAIIERALKQRIGDPATIRDREAYEQALDTLRAHWIANAQQLAEYVDSVLARHQQLQARLRKANPRWLVALDDIRRQLEELITPDFVRRVPDPWSRRLEIYLRGIEKRLERVENNPGKDQQAQAELAPLLEAWAQLARQRGEDDEGVMEIRWLIEELRLQLFSPPLKPVQPVSVKRLFKKIDQAYKG